MRSAANLRYHDRRLLQVVAQRVAAVLSRISSGTDSSAAVADAHLAIEAVTENLALKQKIFSAMDAAAPASCIFASNTSSLSIAAIASATKRSDRFGGLHFFNPVLQQNRISVRCAHLLTRPLYKVPMMKLLEVIRTPQTTDAVNSSLLACDDPPPPLPPSPPASLADTAPPSARR